MSNELKIEAGTYVRLRNKQRAYVALTNKPGDRPIVGWLDGGHLHHWMSNGYQYEDGSVSVFDIIGEWVEPERIPWEHLPKWCRWWAKDDNGNECGFEFRPTRSSSCWAGSEAGGAVYLPAKFNSNYTGDWRNSLRERPEDKR